MAFGNITPTGKKIVIALDVSGSMEFGSISGIPGLSPRVGSSAMAMATARTESNYVVLAFSETIQTLSISPRQRLDDVVRTTSRLPFAGTDCAQPMLWAIDNNINDIDAFVIYTDNETWYGNVHPCQALDKYRNKSGIGSKLIVVGMTATNISIADPSDVGMMDVVGFDTAAPNVMSDFIRQ